MQNDRGKSHAITISDRIFGLEIARRAELAALVSVVLSVVAGVTGNLTGLAFGLVAVTSFSFQFMWLFVEALREMRR